MATFNRLRRKTKRDLSEVDKRDQDAFDRWLASQRTSKSSQQVDLPSSQLLPKMSLVSPSMAQIFAVIDTCSIVTYRSEFIDHVCHLKTLFPRGPVTPIKFIISLVVLEELDKCNRPGKKRMKMLIKDEQKPKDETNKLEGLDTQTREFLSSINILLGEDQSGQTTKINNESTPKMIGEPPRLFMRFLEEEMRLSEVLVSELDAFKKTKLDKDEQAFEIINKDDRILECCLRSRAFIRSLPHHPSSSVVLISEDNVFKAKATTFGVTSYRWREFKAKYKNFGLENYVQTPVVPPQNKITSYFSSPPKPIQDCHPLPDNSSKKTSIELTESRLKLSDSDKEEASKEDRPKPRFSSKLSIRNIYSDMLPISIPEEDDKSVEVIAELINLADESKE